MIDALRTHPTALGRLQGPFGNSYSIAICGFIRPFKWTLGGDYSGRHAFTVRESLESNPSARQRWLGAILPTELRWNCLEITFYRSSCS